MSNNSGGSSRSNDLFSPLVLGPLTLPNRVVMAPMTRNRAADGDVPHALNAEYYAQRAGAGLIITEGAPVVAIGAGYPATPGIYSQAQIDGWQQLTDRVHAVGGRIFLQLWHVGRISHPITIAGETPVAPSAIRPAGEAITVDGMKPYVMPEELDPGGIGEVVDQFAAGARNALQAGFDGVEVHGANGYLLDQFLRDGSNRRGDGYGGSIDNRLRLLMEVTERVIGVWGRERVGVRLSPLNSFNDIRDSKPQSLFVAAASALKELAPVYLHLLEGDMAGSPPSFDYGAMRQAFEGVFMTNGGYDKARAQQALDAGEADLISFGIPFLANPDLPRRMELDADLNAPDQATFYGGGAEGYTDYPALEA